MIRLAATLAATFAAVLIALPLTAAELGDDGLYKPEWLRETLKDLREDWPWP